MKGSRSDGRDVLFCLQALVEELTSPKPEAARIKARMREAGLRYCADPVARAETVLQALSERVAEPLSDASPAGAADEWPSAGGDSGAPSRRRPVRSL